MIDANDILAHQEQIEITEYDEKRKLERNKSDLVSKKLGHLLLQGYRMLNATCDKCECILMQRKDEPTYCVGCQDSEILALNNSSNNSPDINLSVSELKSVDSVKKLPIIKPEPQSILVKNFDNPTSKTNLNQTNPIETLKEKIIWATNELKVSTNLRYNIELCEMIKSASEAILLVKSIEL